MGKARYDSRSIGQDPMRKCHDCGTPTRDYRCSDCQKIFYGDKSARISGEEYGGISIPGGGLRG